jgi:hypothetical protein
VRAATRALQLLELLLGEESLQPFGGEGAGDDLLVEDEIADLALPREPLELAVGEVLRVWSEEDRLDQEQRKQRRDDIADGEFLLFQFHALTQPPCSPTRSDRTLVC